MTQNITFANLIGAVAQSVEQKTENLCVGGSIPSHTTYNPCKSMIYEGCFLGGCNKGMTNSKKWLRKIRVYTPFSDIY